MRPDRDMDFGEFWWWLTLGSTLCVFFLPHIPPQFAAMTFVGLWLAGFIGVRGGTVIADQLESIAEKQEESTDPLEEAQEAYVEGELSDAEFEDELESVIDHER